MNKSQVISLKLTPAQMQKLYDTWHEGADISHPAYSEYAMRLENCVITAYTSGKVVFQGKDAEVYAAPFRTEHGIYPQAGSDEVGTGDYFGPVCVCAVIVEQPQEEKLLSLGIRDSKAVTDEAIREIAPVLIRELKHSLLILPPKRYNEIHTHLNMNAVKAALHNQAFVNLRRKYTLPDFLIIDQFTPEGLYYRYIQGSPEIIRGITFETKAENKYLSVAAGSMIARYAFLTEMDRMSSEYGMEFAKGGGEQADQCALRFVEKYGFDRLQETAKIHFKNTEKIRSKL